MTNSIDTSRSPRGQMAASALVEAVAKVGDFAEHHYLEIKGPLDITKGPARAKIAKFILGAANRMPDKAVSAFEGCAVLIVGVSKNTIEGIPPVEILEISKVIQPFLGADGPLWDAFWIPIYDSPNHVLVLVVEPPKLGQGPFICRANGDGATNGRVYIRVEGATREATADELDLLIKRGSVTQSPPVDFQVQILGEIIPVSHDPMQTLEVHLHRTRSKLLEALQNYKETTHSTNALEKLLSTSSAYKSLLGTSETPEDRTEEEYMDDINDWEKQFRYKWRTVLQKLAKYILKPPVVQIANRTHTFFHDVRIEIHIEGSVVGVEFYGPSEDISLRDLDLPYPPRRWGPRITNHFDYLLPNPPNYYYPTQTSTPSALRWRNKNSIELTIDAGDIRPLATEIVDEEEFVFFLTNSPTEPIHCTWTITARGFNEVFTGEFDIPVGKSLNFDPILANILNPPSRGPNP